MQSIGSTFWYYKPDSSSRCYKQGCCALANSMLWYHEQVLLAEGGRSDNALQLNWLD